MNTFFESNLDMVQHDLFTDTERWVVEDWYEIEEKTPEWKDYQLKFTNGQTPKLSVFMTAVSIHVDLEWGPGTTDPDRTVYIIILSEMPWGFRTNIDELKNNPFLNMPPDLLEDVINTLGDMVGLAIARRDPNANSV